MVKKEIQSWVLGDPKEFAAKEVLEVMKVPAARKEIQVGIQSRSERLG